MFEFCADKVAARGYWAVDGIGCDWSGRSIAMTSKWYQGLETCYWFNFCGFGLGRRGARSSTVLDMGIKG